MQTPIKNITLKIGEDYEEVGYVDDENGVVDISGRTYLAEVKASYAQDATVLASFTFSFLTDGTDGYYVRSMAKEVINALTVTSACWDMFHIEGGLATKLMRGTVTVEPSATDTTPAP